MDAPAMIHDTRLRTLAVIVPAFGLLMYIANELASEEYLAPVFIIAGFIGSMMLAMFAKTIRLEAVFIGFLMIGYLIGNRGFAELSPMKPLYIGELGLAGALLASVIRFLLKRETPDFRTLLPRLVLLYLVMGGIHFAFDVQSYGLNAARDFALVYYCLFYFLAEVAGRQEGSRRFLERCLWAGYCGLAVVYLVMRVTPELLESAHIGDSASFLTQKDDLTATFAATGAFYFYLCPTSRGWRRVGRSLIVLFMAFVFNGFTRSALVAAFATSVLCWIAGRRSFYAYAVVALLAGITILSGYSVLARSGKGSEQISVMRDKIVSIIDIGGKSTYVGDYGVEKSDNNEFRRVFWQSVYDETVASQPIVGLGFGYDFTRRFERVYGRGEWENLRSPHNYFVTVFGRMGSLGLILFSTISVLVVLGGYSAARRTYRGETEAKDLFYWCGAWVLLISSALGVVLEGPMGAILFWSFLGLAVSAPKKERTNAKFAPGLSRKLPAAAEVAREPAFARRRQFST